MRLQQLEAENAALQTQLGDLPVSGRVVRLRAHLRFLRCGAALTALHAQASGPGSGVLYVGADGPPGCSSAMLPPSSLCLPYTLPGGAQHVPLPGGSLCSVQPSQHCAPPAGFFPLRPAKALAAAGAMPPAASALPAAVKQEAKAPSSCAARAGTAATRQPLEGSACGVGAAMAAPTHLNGTPADVVPLARSLAVQR